MKKDFFLIGKTDFQLEFDEFPPAIYTHQGNQVGAEKGSLCERLAEWNISHYSQISLVTSFKCINGDLFIRDLFLHFYPSKMWPITAS